MDRKIGLQIFMKNHGPSKIHGALTDISGVGHLASVSLQPKVQDIFVEL